MLELACTHADLRESVREHLLQIGWGNNEEGAGNCRKCFNCLHCIEELNFGPSDQE